MWNYTYQDELYHHGILGQKWGIRRFQNRDGTYTSAGKRRRNDDLEGTIPNRRSSSGVGKKIATGLAIGAAAGLAAYGVSHLNEDHILAAKDYLARNMPEWKNKAASSLKEAAKKAGKASVEAALAAVGTMAVAKVMNATSKISTGNSNLDQIIRESANAGAKAFINGSTSSGNTYKSGPIDRKKGEEISRIVGPPKQKDIDRTGPEYQALFKDRSGNQRDPDTRGLIKSLASAGYGIDQISEYLDRLDRGEIRHSDIEDELYHHGILGQKWGIRRFQNRDGSLKPAGEKRYYDSDGNYKKQKSTSGSNGKSKSDNSENDGKNSNAYNKAKLARNIAIGAAAVAGTAILAYGASQYIKEHKDLVIDGGEIMQRITTQEEGANLYDNFYAAVGKHDQERYKAFMPKYHLNDREEGEHLIKGLEAKQRMKIASPANAKKVFEDLKKNDREFAWEFENFSYDDFNRGIVGYRQNEAEQKAFNKFREAMKKAGYSGVIDVNDRKYSGYNAKNPAIIFDKGAATVKSMSNLPRQNLKAERIEDGKALVETLLNDKESVTKMLAASAGLSGAYAVSLNSEMNKQKNKKSA